MGEPLKPHCQFVPDLKVSGKKMAWQEAKKSVNLVFDGRTEGAYLLGAINFSRVQLRKTFIFVLDLRLILPK